MSTDAIFDALKLILLLTGMIGSIVELVRVYRADPVTFRVSMRWILVYAIYCGSGIGLVILSMHGPKPPQVALGVTMALMSWIFYGAVWLARVVPKAEPLKPWLARVPGYPEAVLAATAAIGLYLAAQS
jgi:hypothetical protein